MRTWVWRLAFAASWVVLVAVGVTLWRQVFVRVCEDCIGGHPLPGGGYYFGEGGSIVEWGPVVVLSLLFATMVTAILWFGSRARRERFGSRV